MDNIDVNTIELDGKEFFEVDVINNENNKFVFLAEINNYKNIKVFKLVSDGGKEFLENLNDNELDEAFKLFYKKNN